MTRQTIRQRRTLRTRIKMLSVDGYCRGWLPAWFVSAVFFVLRLRAL